ncbi:site-specific integrase [Streptococcus vicugnae]|uniref:Site-specific integrase n=1 Tax=Streptococcus vicugnae TaxID=2740579 RepID=A0A4R5G6D1_9STRE|nr:site-specific integrase [Streptococcus vicugnae]TDE73996.1 site-specific integrase [Streptococcus vicugnae]
MAVTRQKNKKWKVDISDGYDAITGAQKRHRKADFKSRKEAERYEADYRINKLHQIGHKEKVSVTYLYSLVQEEDKLRGNKRGTIDSQESYYRVYVSKYFKNADMRTVSATDIKEYRNWLTAQPSVKGGTLTNSHVNQQMIFVHKLFEVAITNELRQDNPCNGLRRLPQRHKEMAYYTPEQFKQFDALFTREEYQYQLLYRLLMYTGLRIGEALALTWRCINLDEGYIDVKYSAYYRNNQVHIGTVKTTQSNRRIYIHKAFIDELKIWKSNQAELLNRFTSDTSSLQIFQTSPEVLTAPNVSNFRSKFKKRMPKDLKLIRNHDFRHSHAAFLISQGLRNGEGRDYIFFTLMKRLGHSSINTTINVYSHLFPTQQKEIANAFDNF